MSKRLPVPPRATSPAVSAVMRGNRGKNTRPEMAVRRVLRRLGYRYRLHPKEPLGAPDIAFFGRRKLIFVHGCFWHQHQSKRCPLRAHPKSNVYYWKPKLRSNSERDRRVKRHLIANGWRVLVIWECQTRNDNSLVKRLAVFLGTLQRVGSTRPSGVVTPR